MTDRVPTHAGRVQLVPVSGNLYDMTMADEPVEAGTALNKANLMSDAAAAAVWPIAADRPADPTPSAAFEVLGKQRTVVLADHTTSTSAKEQFNLSEDIESFKELDIWAFQSDDSGATHTAFGIYSGDFDYSSATSTERQDYLTKVPNNTSGRKNARVVFTKNDSVNGSERLVAELTGSAGSISVIKTGGYKSGKVITLDKTVSGTEDVCPGVRIIIIGRSY